jgi:hypothetical protein
VTLAELVAWVMLAALIAWVGIVLYATFRTIDGEAREASKRDR